MRGIIPLRQKNYRIKSKIYVIKEINKSMNLLLILIASLIAFFGYKNLLYWIILDIM